MSEPSGGNGNVIVVTLKDVYVELMKIKESLLKVEEGVRSIPDHETRIRSLEKWRYGLPVSMVMALVSIAVAVISLYGHH